MPNKFLWLSVLFINFHLGTLAWGQETRIKDLVNVQGYRSNQLMGLGLVVGLQGTGDSKAAMTTNQAATNLMRKLGMNAKPDTMLVQSMAVVAVTAELPAFAKIGDRIDIKVSTLADAKSLAGGTLLMTPLKAVNGDIFVMAQGPVVIGTATGRGTQVLTVANLPASGVVEREFTPQIGVQGLVNLHLKETDFTTNARIVEKINAHFKGFYAVSRDPSRIEVKMPPTFGGRVIEFMAELESLRVESDHKAVVIFNEKTGTVVMGADVAIADVVVNHGELSIQVGEGKNTRSEGVVKLGGATIGGLVKTLNDLGVKSSDLVGVLQAIHAAGALKGELRFM